MSRMHKRRREKRNAYEMQKAMSDMIDAASANSSDNSSRNENINVEELPSDTVDSMENATNIQLTPSVPVGAQIGATKNDGDDDMPDDNSDDSPDNPKTLTYSNKPSDVQDSEPAIQITADDSTDMSSNDSHNLVAGENNATNIDSEVSTFNNINSDGTKSDEQQQSTADVPADNDDLESNVQNTAAETENDQAATTEHAVPNEVLNDNLVPNGHETLQEQADRIAKAEASGTIAAIDSQLDKSGANKEIDDFISAKIKESLTERDALRRKNDKNGVARVGKRLNAIAALRDSNDENRTLDDIIAGYNKIMKDEDDRLTLIAQREAEIEEKERIKRVDALAHRLKRMPIEDAREAIAEIDGDDYMTLAERHAALVSDITSYVEPVEQPSEDTSESDAVTATANDSHDVTNEAANTAYGIAAPAVPTSNEDAEAKSNGLKEYYDRYGGEPTYQRPGSNNPNQPQSEKSKRRQERKQREKARQELLEKRAAERAAERAEQEGVTVDEIINNGDKPLIDEEIAKRNKKHKSGKLAALSVIKAAIGIASIGGVEGYAIYEALKSVHDNGTALSGFSSIEHMIVPMLIAIAAWFVLSIALRAVSKSVAADTLAKKVDRDANVKAIAYLSADRGVCGKTVLIDVLRAVSMIVAGGLTLTGVGALAGSDTAMGVSYGFAVLLIVIGIIGKHMYLFGSDDDDDEDAVDDGSVTYGLAEIQRRIELANAAFRPLLAASVASIIIISITTFMPLRTGAQLFDLGTDAWLSFGAIASLALGRCIAIWMPRGAEDSTSFSSFAWSLLLMFGLASATALFVIGQYAPAALAVALIVLICIGLKVLGRGRDSIADLNDYEIE